MVESIDSNDLTFLDGYLYRVLVEFLHAEGAEQSGLYDYYKARIELGIALSDYDRALAHYVATHFPRDRHVVVHAGTGIGTLPSALTASGYRTAGVEQDERRFRAADRMRAALAQAWPEAASRYELIAGEFPAVVEGTSWMTPQTVLIFTNCVAGWSEDHTARTIASLGACGDILLDVRVFGRLRDTEEEREILVKQIEAQGISATPIPQNSFNTFFYHLRTRPNIS